MGLLKKLESLDQRLFPKKHRTKIYSAIAGALVSLVAISGGIKYNAWRNEYVHREAENVTASRYLDDIASDCEANRLLFEFPNKIPGAERVDKYVTPGSRYCLVHVRQEHYPKESKIKNLSDKTISNIEQVQNSIYDILTHIHEKYNVNGILGVHNEGEYNLIIPCLEEVSNKLKDVDSIKEKLLNKFEKDYNGPLWVNNQIQNEFEVIFNKMDIGKLKKELETCQDYYLKIRELRKKMLYAVDRLVLEGKVQSKGFERFDKQDFAGFLLDQGIFIPETYLDDREDSFLEYGSDSENPLIFLVLGGAHAFAGKKSFGDGYKSYGRDLYDRDNIAEWNKQNPDKKFSLIEITPKNYNR